MPPIIECYPEILLAPEARGLSHQPDQSPQVDEKVGYLHLLGVALRAV